jgi:DNA repair photolyase
VPTRARTRGARATTRNIPNRFERLAYVPLPIDLPPDDELPPAQTTFFRDTSRTILAKNDSPDLPFTYSINPYRGCEHGCIYCYARPSHEYLGFSAGLDFETKIMVKPDAPRLLEQAFRKRNWKPQIVVFSGNTDCYQPMERQLGLTRQCLEVFLRFRNPAALVTKNALVLRDSDVLREMAALNLVHVMISITSLKPELLRVMEPRASTPARRLDALENLARAGIPVGVNVAPIIPGLTDEELPAILKAAADRGATTAGYILVRLPGAVQPLFLDWLHRHFPDRAQKVVNRLRDTRDGRLTDARFGSRIFGQGEIARTIQSLFDLHVSRYHLEPRWCGLTSDRFRTPSDSQGNLFEE